MEGSYELSFVQNVSSLININLYYVTHDIMKSKHDLSDTSKYFYYILCRSNYIPEKLC